jgi:hypothetical protein
LAECPDIDILGTTFILGDAFIKKEELNKPILFTELVAIKLNAEDQKSQAYF